MLRESCVGKISRCGAGRGIAIANPPFDLLDLTRDRPSAGGRREEEEDNI